MYIRGTTPTHGAPVAVAAGAYRRMSPTQLLATQQTLQVINAAGIHRPDAIFSATALGCLVDTETFLGEINTGGDTLRSPLPFMRSTHNTIAGQLALTLGVTGPNITFSQGTHGAADAMLAAMMHLEEEPDHQALVVVWDEHAPLTADLIQTIAGTAAPALGGGLAALLLGGEHLPSDQALVRAIIQWDAVDDPTWWERLPALLPPRSIAHVAWAGAPGMVVPPITLAGARVERFDHLTGAHGARMGQAVEGMAKQMAHGDIVGPAMVLDVWAERRAAIILEPCPPTV